MQYCDTIDLSDARSSGSLSRRNLLLSYLALVRVHTRAILVLDKQEIVFMRAIRKSRANNGRGARRRKHPRAFSIASTASTKHF